MKRIPVIPVPMEKALGATKHLLNWGEFFSNLFPGLAFELEQSEFKFEPREWVALALFTGMFYFSSSSKGSSRS